MVPIEGRQSKAAKKWQEAGASSGRFWQMLRCVAAKWRLDRPKPLIGVVAAVAVAITKMEGCGMQFVCGSPGARECQLVFVRGSSVCPCPPSMYMTILQPTQEAARKQAVRKPGVPKSVGSREMRGLDSSNILDPVGTSTGPIARSQMRNVGLPSSSSGPLTRSQLRKLQASGVSASVMQEEALLVTAEMGSSCIVLRNVGGSSKKQASRKAKRRIRELSNPLMQPSKTSAELAEEEVRQFSSQVSAAKAAERLPLSKCQAFHPEVWDPEKHKNRMTARWALKFKPGMGDADPRETGDGRRAEARYVVRGYLETELDGTDPPTASRGALMLALAASVNFGTKIELGDVPTAFLQGSPLKRAVQIDLGGEESEWGIPEGSVMCLDRAVYGLKDDPALWYQAFIEAAEELGGEVHVLEEGLIRWTSPEGGIGVAVLHVDDCVFSGCERFFRVFVQEGLRARFPFGPAESAQRSGGVEFTGLQILREDEGSAHVLQAAYVDGIHPVECNSSRSGQQALAENGVEGYRSALGAIQWTVQRSRPDLSYECADAAGRAGTLAVDAGSGGFEESEQDDCEGQGVRTNRD